MINDRLVCNTLWFLVATLFGYIESSEHTAKSSNFQRQIRFWQNWYKDKHPKDYQLVLDNADRVWMSAQNQINNKHYLVSVQYTAMVLEGFLSDMRVKHPLSMKKFNSALNSMSHNEDKERNVLQIESDSSELITLFAEGLGIKKKSLSWIKAKVINEGLL